jgi:molybdopterin molybdotransferase
MMGYNFEATNISLKMGEDYSRKNKKRMSWIPISINENSDIIPLKYHGSAHINALTYADGLINVPVGKTSLKKGDFVNVRQI